MPYIDMDVCRDKESKAIQKEVNKFASGSMRPAGIELDSLADPDLALLPDSVLWEVFGTSRKLDLHLPGIPEDLGGLGKMHWMAPVFLAEGMGRGDVGLAISLLASNAPFQIAAQSSSQVLKKMVKAYCEDEDCQMIGCMALDMDSPALPDAPCRATPGKGVYLLDGEVQNAFNAPIATHAMLDVVVESKDLSWSPGIAIISLDRAGVSKGAPRKTPGQRSLVQGSLRFENVKIPKGSVILEKPETIREIRHGFFCRHYQDLGAIFSGMALAAWEEALEYAKGRIQGGVPIFQHANIRMQFFNMLKNLEAVRAQTRRLAQYLNQINGNKPLVAAAATKCLATQTAVEVASEAIQILGGYGLTREFPMEKFFRDAQMGMIQHGINEDLALAAMAES